MLAGQYSCKVSTREIPIFCRQLVDPTRTRAKIPRDQDRAQCCQLGVSVHCLRDLVRINKGGGRQVQMCVRVGRGGRREEGGAMWLWSRTGEHLGCVPTHPSHSGVVSVCVCADESVPMCVCVCALCQL